MSNFSPHPGKWNQPPAVLNLPPWPKTPKEYRVAVAEIEELEREVRLARSRSGWDYDISEESWPAINQRRCELIDKEVNETLTDAEFVELADLEHAARRYLSDKCAGSTVLLDCATEQAILRDAIERTRWYREEKPRLFRFLLLVLLFALCVLFGQEQIRFILEGLQASAWLFPLAMMLAGYGLGQHVKQATSRNEEVF